jgi:hypothetical protein
MLVLFAFGLCLNALLLFWVQPMFGKMALPLLGGSPSVWTTCMLFFQAALLAGYAYAHAGVRLLGMRRHALLHASLVWVPLLVLPVGLQGAGAPPTDREPIAWLLRMMTSHVGLPFIVLATSAPLLQRWFSAIGHRWSSDPYFLYAASNVGSLVALLAFPIVMEPLVPLQRQQSLWHISYVVVAAVLTMCAVVVFRQAPENSSATMADQDSIDRPSVGQRARWLSLSFAPSALMLAVTTYLSTDVAAVPLMWVVPLGLYLLTFIVAFGSGSASWGAIAARLLPVIVLPLIVTLILAVRSPLSFFIPLHLTVFAVLALLCHVELSRRRPSTQHLTEYYLWLAAGGMLGGVFNTLLAPRLFTGVAEYPLAIAFGCALLATSQQVRQIVARPQLLVTPALAGAIATAVVIAGGLGVLTTLPTTGLLGAAIVMCFSVRRDQARFAFGVAGLFVALGAGALAVPVQGGDVLHAERTFFGVYRVYTAPEFGFVSLAHGTTLHGRQIIGDVNPEPLSYYHRKSPIGDILAARGERAKSVGIVGLGVGTLAAYAKPESRWVFYEIDPAVERIARDNRFFRYLEACGGRCTVALGDARLTLARTMPRHDILVLDAFSSDAIPVHLLTIEAMDVYEKSLAPDGVLAFHISNRHIRLRPVVARLARERGWTVFGRLDSGSDTKRGDQQSEWVVMTRRPEDLDVLPTNPGWTRIVPGGEQAWSDDFSNVWTALKWREQ